MGEKRAYHVSGSTDGCFLGQMTEIGEQVDQLSAKKAKKATGLGSDESCKGGP